MTGRLRLVVRGAAVAALLALAVFAGFRLVYPRLPGPGDGRTVEVVVARGAGPAAVGRAVAAAGLVRWGALFALHLRLERATPRLRFGRFRLRDDASPAEVLAAITRPAPGGTARVTIPEGFDLLDVADALADAGVVPRAAFLAAARDAALLSRLGVPAPTAEGYLFPDTYDLRAGRDTAAARRAVGRLVETFHRRTGTSLGDLDAAARHGIVVLGSIVEAEARSPAERPRIAAVFANRLRAPDFMPRILQADPTVAYGCRVDRGRAAPSCAGFRGRLSRRHLEDVANRYNTYVHEGLPPGPICNPGLPALVAARHPLQTDELYFVARGDGTHAFARTLAQHQANVRRYRR